MKMDIEGAELEILEQMHERDFFDRIRLTVAETHENKFKALRPRFQALREKPPRLSRSPRSIWTGSSFGRRG